MLTAKLSVLRWFTGNFELRAANSIANIIPVASRSNAGGILRDKQTWLMTIPIIIIQTESFWCRLICRQAHTPAWSSLQVKQLSRSEFVILGEENLWHQVDEHTKSTLFVIIPHQHTCIYNMYILWRVTKQQPSEHGTHVTTTCCSRQRTTWLNQVRLSQLKCQWRKSCIHKLDWGLTMSNLWPNKENITYLRSNQDTTEEEAEPHHLWMSEDMSVFTPQDGGYSLVPSPPAMKALRKQHWPSGLHLM